jgi:hypothetical protein
LRRRGGYSRGLCGDLGPRHGNLDFPEFVLALTMLLTYGRHSRVDPIRIGLVGDGAVSWVFVIAGFLSNMPEGPSVAAGMKEAGHPTGTARSRVRCPIPYS